MMRVVQLTHGYQTRYPTRHVLHKLFLLLDIEYSIAYDTGVTNQVSACL